MATTYLLPLKSSSLHDLDDLSEYFSSLAGVNILIVDGSPAPLFAAHNARWSGLGRHIAPDPAIRGLNGKVRGVLTGIRSTLDDKIIIADDDVRYDAASLLAIISMLDWADVVRPQNYFSPHRWHTVLDTSRTLINRITGGDWPGTLAVRREALAEGYNPNVLFENLELVRTIVSRGGREHIAEDVYVARCPPTTAHYLSQRVRQAYDEFARPERLIAALCVLPIVATLVARKRFDALTFAAVCSMVCAELGRRKAGGARYFPVLAALMAPAWILERGACAWLALYARVRHGGVRYGDAVIKHAAGSVQSETGRVA